MMEWKKCKIADLGRVVTGKTPSTKEKSYWGGDVPFITPKDLQAQKHILLTERNISEQGKQAVKNSILPAGSICVSCIGNIGYTGVTVAESVTNQQINSIIPFCREEMDFIYYTIRNLWGFFKHYEGQSTALSILNKTQFEKIEVTIPTNQEGRFKIGAVLRSIDEKIEENIAINHNLQQQAQAYFQELFVDNTDPVWTLGTVSDLGTVVGGSTPSKSKPEYYTKSGIAWITPKDLSINKAKFISHGENDITELGLKNSSASIMPEGTVLFSSRAPIGYIAIASSEVTTNQGFKSVVPKPEIGTAYVYYFLKRNLPVIEGMASGSTFKEVSGSTMKNVPAIIPDTKALACFNDFCSPIFTQQKILEEQNQSLAALRDSLLPKLMSGEINVSGIQL